MAGRGAGRAAKLHQSPVAQGPGVVDGLANRAGDLVVVAAFQVTHNDHVAEALRQSLDGVEHRLQIFALVELLRGGVLAGRRLGDDRRRVAPATLRTTPIERQPRDRPHGIAHRIGGGRQRRAATEPQKQVLQQVFGRVLPQRDAVQQEGLST